jgi:pyruvate kinase
VHRVARHRPHCPIIALTPHATTVQSLAVHRGVFAFQIKPMQHLDDVIAFIPEFLRSRELAEKGDRIIVTAGLHFNIPGSTNMIMVLEV